jgi:hypothetical protein
MYSKNLLPALLVSTASEIKLYGPRLRHTFLALEHLKILRMISAQSEVHIVYWADVGMCLLARTSKHGGILWRGFFAGTIVFHSVAQT